MKASSLATVRACSGVLLRARRTQLAGSLSGDLYVLSLATGEQLQHYGAGAPLAASPSVGGGYLVLATADGTVLALGPRRGGSR